MGKSLTPDMQKAAVRAALSGGQSLDEVKRAYGKELADSIKAVEKELATSGRAPQPRRSGSTSQMKTVGKRPTF